MHNTVPQYHEAINLRSYQIYGVVEEEAAASKRMVVSRFLNVFAAQQIKQLLRFLIDNMS